MTPSRSVRHLLQAEFIDRLHESTQIAVIMGWFHTRRDNLKGWAAGGLRRDPTQRDDEQQHEREPERGMRIPNCLGWALLKNSNFKAIAACCGMRPE